MGSASTKLCRCRKFHILAIWVFRSIYFYRCGKLLVSANPLTFNGICFDKAFPIRNSFISLFFTGSLFPLQAFTFYGQPFRLSPFGGIGGPERTVIFVCCVDSSSLSTDSSGQLDIFRHDGNPPGVDGTKVGVFKQSNQISFRSLLQGHNCCTLESDFAT